MSDQLTREIISTISNRAISERGEPTTATSSPEVTMSTELSSLGLDSLALADILWDLEQANNIKIEMNTADAWSNLQTVGDVVVAVRSLLAKEA
ncbi:acyl carrier protein [Sinorhizobium saheli]|uniref:Nodulation protein NodF n=1 Tax=Sinorhizobium saheli TaxID=36856 RepID=A0A178XY57_SINSA|nr:acyl carrier protein [Sinorhizobium saheli]MQW86682.1 nodulation protein NodF [Sinorhizobium saheli]OAP40177.1 nodulation protein NodF [Sinorhizobium saheli]